MNKELKKLLTEAKKSGWTVTQEDGNVYDFGWWSPAGQDFHIQVDTENDVGYFLHNLYSVYNDFDVSVETYLWLDDTGHGRNGAPYDMKDVYEDMETCEEAIHDLWEALDNCLCKLPTSVN
ncbi:hypothetical protein [Congzhengia minquanensis]|uniref:Uncharacterized protein n=1 Tax=Congzhengia minquanensis TaxID=2763657 RepID=A0A926HZ57_9FIRM|nr:hypothetical protein [Congzhengia minquanensis]MBC8540815.1 hypothetical protein [Congzhengia minquanensis]